MDSPKSSFILSLRGMKKEDRVRIQTRLDALRNRQNAICVALQRLEEHIARVEAPIFPAQTWQELGEEYRAALWRTVIREISRQEHIEEHQVLNAWHWGSRWFGDNVPNSDFDFMLVVRGWKQPRGKHYHVVKAPRVDICLFSEEVREGE